MKTLSLIAQKGGTGKTSLSIHLAVQASLSGMKVLLVDTDPQASATAWWKRREEATPELIQCRGENLPRVLNAATGQGFDLVVVDTAPHSSKESTACARMSDWVYIPSRPAILDLDAIGASTELVTAVDVPARILLNCCPPATRFGEPHIVTEARQALKVYGIPVCEVAISQRAAFSHALIDGRAVTEFDRKTKAALEIDRLWKTMRQEMSL
ncbi:MAG: ParA family protein [Gammaproteobacteria bacterium]|nr:ParA family protein [Gammaproteobacteria bacterium]